MVDHSLKIVVDTRYSKMLWVRHRDLDLDSLAGIHVVVEPHESEVEEWRHLREDRSSCCITELVTVRAPVLIVAAHPLSLEDRVYCSFEIDSGPELSVSQPDEVNDTSHLQRLVDCLSCQQFHARSNGARHTLAGFGAF